MKKLVPVLLLLLLPAVFYARPPQSGQPKPLVLTDVTDAPGTSQDPQPSAPDRARIIAAARDLMQKARYCAFVTMGEDGYPQARVVDPFSPDEDMTIWVGTNPLTRKVAQIKRNPHVTLFYFHTASYGYVTVLGQAVLVADPAEKAKRWKAEWSGLYKDRETDYLLIKVKPVRLEVLSPAHGLMSDPKTWRPVMLDLL